MTWRRRLSFGIFALTAALVARPAAAQLAPTGTHYANQGSDTGFSGGVNSSGGYSASVPLDLPAARGGLPVPVQIYYSERAVGAAGLGWDVPLSFIRRDTTFAHRRPMGTAPAGPQVRERVSLVLGGRVLELVRSTSGWVARQDAPDILAREQNGTWLVFDGQGRTYLFTVPAPALAGTGLWFLQDVTGAGGSKVHLTYSVGTRTVPGSEARVSIDLVRVDYNPHPNTANCYKNAVALDYDAPAATPLSLTMVDTTVMERLRKLTQVNVLSRETCGSTPVNLRRYTLSYTPDPDTHQPRLQSVKMFGRDSTPEASTALPVASYTYGTATSGGKLRYVAAEGVSAASLTRPSTNKSQTQSLTYWTENDLMDVSGDGLLDNLRFVDVPVGMDIRKLLMVAFLDWKTPLAQWFHANTPVDARTLPLGRYQEKNNAELVWRQSIDVNGDGRIDLIDAAEEAGHWVVWLNAPDLAVPTTVRWIRRTYSTATLASHLSARGHSVDPNHVPLARRTTTAQKIKTICLFWDTVAWVHRPWSLSLCQGQGPEIDFGPESTYTDWEIKDINGDGYPDVVFNSSPILFDEFEEPDPEPPFDPNTVTWSKKKKTTTPFLPETNEIWAVFNVLGVRFDLGSQPFSWVTSLRSGDVCGVARWRDQGDDRQTLECDLADVNGDGLVDRVRDTSVFLGTGKLAGGGYFTPGALLALPGPLAIQTNSQPKDCDPPANGNTLFDTQMSAGLRDLTGDGLPDYVFEESANTWKVRIGTGTGFLGPIEIEGAKFGLSRQREKCAGTVSAMHAALYDTDGDGKPDLITDDNVVKKLMGSDGMLGAPEAGRLVQIDNGYGASTKITYRSAKRLLAQALGARAMTARHQVPFPEVVVGSVQTTTQDASNNLAAVRYAYGGAQLVFDPVADRFTFPGYRRSVELYVPTGQQDGIAVITDAYGPAETTDPYDLVSAPRTHAERYALYLRVGEVSDVTVLSGTVGTDPSALLSVNVTTDARRIASTHHEYDARLLPTGSDPPGPEPCNEMVYPYDHAASVAHSNIDACRRRGFGFTTSTQSSRGEPGAAAMSAATVNTRFEVRTIDDFGRVVSAKQLGDLARTDDDLCIDTSYAVPTGSDERVLSADTSQTVTDCGTIIYAKETWQYDKLALGQVSVGLPTSHTVERRDESGTLLDAIRTFDATYTATANPVTVNTTREDGASRAVTMTYDAFALVPVIVTTTATGLPQLRTDLVRDPVTLNVTSARDPNGTSRGTTFDGFDRPVLSLVTPPGGTLGALSVTSYHGFALGDSSGRRITHKVFTDPVNLASAPTATGRSATVFLDELDREHRTEVTLGADYPGQKLIAGKRSYDSLGRVVFEADPYPSSQSAATAYGTTWYFNADGTPSCSIRGNGPQPFTLATNEGSEIYPTCLTRTFQSNAEIVSVRSADSLLAGSPQAGVTKTASVTAIGRLLSRATWQGANRLEYATFTQDRLGHQTSMTRYQDAASGGNPITSRWHLDSLGQVLRLDEPDSVPQLHIYSDWGELLETTRTGGGVVKRVVQTYDAYGRLIHSEHRNNSIVDTETVNDYLYDQPVQAAPQVNATFVLGRLAQASWPTGSVSFSYDGLGRTNARVFTDNESSLFVEKHTLHGDGTPRFLDLFLPDTVYINEHVAYTYDSAGRGRSVTYSVDGNQASTQNLYQASTIDPFGRVRQAQYGQTVFTASYGDLGRRLMSQVALTSPLGTRSITFQNLDPVGRERSRTEVKSGPGAPTTTTTSFAYDALGRLASALQTSGGTTLLSQQYNYDPLGNILGLINTGGASTINTTMTYMAIDRDRICRIAYGTDTGTACNVTYDEFGSILSQPTATGNRQYSYLVDGSVRTITNDQSSSAHYRYDAFGDVHELDLTSTVSLDTRQDRHHGSFITRRKVGELTLYTRKIPGPDGFLASRQGPGGSWVFAFGEARGNRFFADQTGAFVQDVDYQPFGKATSTGAQPNTLLYTSEQWNGGDSLTAFGIYQLGARLYDPAIGRFLSRDPLFIPRTAATTNPYAFAHNDPINSSDPSGLDVFVCNKISGGGTCVNENGWAGSTRTTQISVGFNVGNAGGWVPLNPRPWDTSKADKGSSSDEAGDGGGSTTPISEAGARAPGGFVHWENGVPLFYHGNGTIEFLDGYADGDPGLETFVGTRIPSSSDSNFLAPRRFYTNPIAAQLAAHGFVHMAELYEAGHGCAVCHVQHNLNRMPTDAEFNMNRYYYVSGLTGGGRMAIFATPFRAPMSGGPGLCFVAGTLVLTSTGAVPIENLKLGDRVEVGNPDCADRHFTDDTVTIGLELPNPQAPDDIIRIEIARSLTWLREHDLGNGEVQLDGLEELGLSGRATLTYVLPAPTEQPGKGCLVLMTMEHVALEVLKLRFETGTELQVTPTHRLFVEGSSWMQVREMKPGMLLRSDHGGLRLDAVESTLGGQWVYNLEVDLEHTYRVSADHIWAHNNGCRKADVVTASGQRAAPNGTPLGPSGKPVYHNSNSSTRKQAIDGAKAQGSGRVAFDSANAKQSAHWHAVKPNGRRVGGPRKTHWDVRGAKTRR